MKVEAIGVGFDGMKFIHPGDVFEIPDKPDRLVPTGDPRIPEEYHGKKLPVAFSWRWMKPASKRTAEHITGAGQTALNRELAEIRTPTGNQERI